MQAANTCQNPLGAQEVCCADLSGHFQLPQLDQSEVFAHLAQSGDLFWGRRLRDQQLLEHRHAVGARKVLRSVQPARIFNMAGDERLDHRLKTLANFVPALEIAVAALPSSQSQTDQRACPKQHHNHNRENNFSDVLDEEGHSAEFANLPELSLPVCWSRSRRRAGAPLLALRLNSAHRRALWCYTRVASVKPNSSVHNLDLIELSAKSLGGP